MQLQRVAQECRALLTSSLPEYEDETSFLNFGFVHKIVRLIKNPKWVALTFAVLRHLIFGHMVYLLSTSPQIYIIENRKIIKLWIGYDLNLGGHDLIEVLSKNFSGVTEEIYKILPS